MSLIDDIMKALDRWETWHELQKLPTAVRALEIRIAELETQLGGKWPPDVCKFCGERAVRLDMTYAPNAKGKVPQSWHCGSCDKYENRLG